MNDYYRALRADYLTDSRLTPEMALVMNYLVAQEGNFEVVRPHLYRVFAGRIGVERVKRALAGLARLGYLVKAPAVRRPDGTLAQDGAKMNLDQLIYRGRTDGAVTELPVTELPVTAPTTTTKNQPTKNHSSGEERGTDGADSAPPVKLAGIEGPRSSGSRIPSTGIAPELPGSATSGSSPQAEPSSAHHATRGRTQSEPNVPEWQKPCGNCGFTANQEPVWKMHRQACSGAR